MTSATPNTFPSDHGGPLMSSTVTDNIYERPEVLRLSDAAFRMHVRALAWAAAHGTAPELPDYALPSVSPLTGGIDLITELVGAGLWRATEIDDLGYVLDGALPPTSPPPPKLAYLVQGDTDGAVAFFRDVAIAEANQRMGIPFDSHVLAGVPRAEAIIKAASVLLRGHRNDGHHDLDTEVHLGSGHPYIRAKGNRADEWLRSALAAGELTVDDPDWRGHTSPELTAFVEGTSCYPGWAEA